MYKFKHCIVASNILLFSELQDSRYEFKSSSTLNSLEEIYLLAIGHIPVLSPRRCCNFCTLPQKPSHSCQNRSAAKPGTKIKSPLLASPKVHQHPFYLRRLFGSTPFILLSTNSRRVHYSTAAVA
ncbi:hypothetical protein AVEN_257386-1 [Araneus ventricosus]|uniref:Uncharacterized protein n=1 Tax=Araneus ventricosus TaxID=182803 RepID=A0A4Y2C8W1_ARAVE|nr:hypothetical protein AVEN_257386-1 [Araneus ventricosus]